MGKTIVLVILGIVFIGLAAADTVSKKKKAKNTEGDGQS